MYSLSSDYPALSSAIDQRQTPEDGSENINVTSCPNLTDCVSSVSDNEAVSEPESMECSRTREKDRKLQKSPGLSYIALISMAIQSSSDKRMLLSEIYQWISERYPYYNMKEKSWRNSIRHNLSLNECFVKNGRSENGKGNYWSIHPANLEDFAKGDYRRRRARRLVRKCDEDLQRLCTRSPYPAPVSPVSDTSPSSSNEGYVPMVQTKVSKHFLSSLGVDHKPYEEWNYHNYPYNVSSSYKPGEPSMYPNESCSPLYSYYTDHCTGLYSPGPSGKHAYTRPTSLPGELNVNVNVNVCGNNGSSMQYASPSSPSYYVPTCTQVYKQQPLHGCAYTDPAHALSYTGNTQSMSGCSYNGQLQGYPYNGTSMEKSSEEKE